MSPSITIWAAAFGGATAAFTPRLAHRLAVPSGAPPRSACADCARPFPPGPQGWVRAGPACRCSGRQAAAVVAGTAAAGLLGVSVGATPLLPVLLPAVALGVLLTAIDVRCLRLPDPLVAALTAVTVPPLTTIALAAAQPGRLGRAALAAVLVSTAYLIIGILPGGGLGLGDVKLAAVLAFVLGFVGWPAVAVGLVAPHLLNGPVAIFLLVRRRAGRRTPLPLGPALLAGALLGVVAG
jgi:leader peptidase (prepilin peptidase)/N-methyltransferase